MSHRERDGEYLACIQDAVRVCAGYQPRFGHGMSEGCSLDGFRRMYGADPFYSWMGLDNPLLYAAHKAAGGMTSIYRQVGIGCENLFRKVLRDALKMPEDSLKWSYAVETGGGKTKTLYLDACVTTASIGASPARRRISRWIAERATTAGMDRGVAAALKGIVFEVRQGYKSKDSKRQNADITNAAKAIAEGYLPCLAVLSLQIDSDIEARYRNARWVLLKGNATQDASPQQSLYAFMKHVVGYDLAEFFQRHSRTIREDIRAVLEKLLSTR